MSDNKRKLSYIKKSIFLESAYETYKNDNLDYLFALMDSIRITINIKRGKTTLEDELSICEGYIHV